jgi:hypothetical protein
MHRQSALLLAILGLGAALATGCAGASAAESAHRIQVVMHDNHLVAVAYRAEAKSQHDCFRKMRTGVITSDEEAAGCLSAGLTASHLEDAIGTFHQHVLDVGESGDNGCRAAANRLASVIAQEQAYIHASHEDLARLDGEAYDDDGTHAGEMAAREADPSAAMVRACMGG